MDEFDLFDSFIQKWTSPEYPPQPLELNKLIEVEQRYQFNYPEVFRNWLLKIGSCGTVGLLDSIVEAELELNDLSDLLTATEIIESTDGWRKIGLPDDLVAFGCDCMGSLFCFKISERQKEGQFDAPIWFYDHDFNTVHEISDGFVSFINALVEVERVDV